MPVASDNIAISIHEVTKKYRLFSSPRERLKEAFHPFRKRYHHEFWALKGVSFDVLKGQTVGIIGRNGSGKSTLLQIICSILQPTSGNVTVNGRVGSLLELGAGFNPEFTGRENVMLNGAITGIPRAQMSERMPEIEAFADIGEFFDQPVKTYSSGMFVRLAFAAAINVDPDILVVDEALAVGDAKFQHRCFTKFQEFRQKGVAIVLVTHDIDALVRHCGHAFLLHRGEIIASGVPKEVAANYLDLLEGRNVVTAMSEAEFSSPGDANGRGEPNAIQLFVSKRTSGDMCSHRRSYNDKEHNQESSRVAIVDYLIVSGKKVDPTYIDSSETIDVYMKVQFMENIEGVCFGLSIKTTDGIKIYALNSLWIDRKPVYAGAGDQYIVRFRLGLPLNLGDVFLDLGVDEVTGSRTYRSLARRLGIAHLVVRLNHTFHGLVDLGAEFDKIARLSA